MTTDLVGQFLRKTPAFRGKWRVARYWCNHCIKSGERRIATLPDGSKVNVNMDVGYERMVWLQQEEWSELTRLRRRLKPGDLFIDVGANIGLWTLVSASAVGPGGCTIALEPNPATFAKLEDNLRLNLRVGNVIALSSAASDSEGVASFCCTDDHNLSSLASGNSDPSNCVQVKTTTIDAIVDEVPSRERLSGMKIDTEGHELSTLRGAERSIQRASPWLIVEFNTTLLPSNQLADWEVYSFLTGHGYRAFLHDADDPQPLGADFHVDGYLNILFKK